LAVVFGVEDSGLYWMCGRGFFPKVARLERDALVLCDACTEMKVTISSLIYGSLMFALREALHDVS